MALLQKMREDQEIVYAGSAYIVAKAVDTQRNAHYLKNLSEQAP